MRHDPQMQFIKTVQRKNANDLCDVENKHKQKQNAHDHINF